MQKLIVLVLFTLVAFSFANVEAAQNILQNSTSCTYPPISKRTTFILSVIPFTGQLAIDRFYSLWTKVGLVKLLVGIFCDVCTCGLFSFIFWLCDFISLATNTPIPPYTYQTDGNGCPFAKDF